MDKEWHIEAWPLYYGPDYEEQSWGPIYYCPDWGGTGAEYPIIDSREPLEFDDALNRAIRIREYMNWAFEFRLVSVNEDNTP